MTPPTVKFPPTFTFEDEYIEPTTYTEYPGVVVNIDGFCEPTTRVLTKAFPSTWAVLVK